MVLLIYLLFFAESMGRTQDKGYQYNLVPFQEIRRYVRYWDVLGWKIAGMNLFGNVLAFMPFGFFIPKLVKGKKNAFFIILYSFELSLLVEVLQLAFKLGSFDVDDIILNTLGGFLGYVCHLIFIRFRRKQNVSDEEKTK